MSANLAEDYQDAQHQDELIRQKALLEQLVEVSLLIASDNHSWLTERDVENIACACGVFDLYKQAINTGAK